MNKDFQEGKELIDEIISHDPNIDEEKKLIIIPPFVHLSMAAELLKNSTIDLGAQNIHHEPEGAFTGEVSASMISSLGLQYCLVGHSERRSYQKESDQELISKVKLLLSNAIRPIFCIGETLDKREEGKEKEVILQQLQLLFELNDNEFRELILAYEPVWAIGTGRTASADQAQEMHAFIRESISKQYGSQMANDTTILYGGSCKAENAKELFAKEDVDGGLIGGASLEAHSFLAIFKSL